MEIVDVNELNITKAETFLKGIVEKVDEKVLENASLLIDNGKIIGMMSFECFGKLALIRYFVFTKMIDEKNLYNLFNNVITKAKKKNIHKVLSFVENEDTIPLFAYLGFTEIDKKYVFIDERNIMKTDSKDAIVYCYQIN